MFQITSKGSREAIERAGLALTEMDPSPAQAVDTKEETRTLWRLDAYADDTDRALGCVGVIELVSPDLSASYQQLDDIDWVSKSLEGLPTVAAGPFIVGGAHALATSIPGKLPIWIEAGPAFGTGHHGTTLGCLTAMSKLLKGRKVDRVLDLGTGSGVLGIASLKAGAKSVIGTDIDAESVRIARINAANNKVAGRMRVVEALGADSTIVRTSAPYDLVVANILANPLIGLSKDAAHLTKPGGKIVLSGLLTHQEPLVRAAYEARGLTLVDRYRIDGWSTLVYRKPKRARAVAVPAKRLPTRISEPESETVSA